MQVKLATSGEIRWVVDNLYPQYDKQFAFPELKHSIVNLSVLDEGKLIGFASIRKILEGVVILASEPRERVKMLNELIKHGRFYSHSHGYNQLHAFIQDENFENTLTKHFGFRATSGKCLVTDV
jgi:hypothetical protein